MYIYIPNGKQRFKGKSGKPSWRWHVPREHDVFDNVLTLCKMVLILFFFFYLPFLVYNLFYQMLCEITRENYNAINEKPDDGRNVVKNVSYVMFWYRPFEMRKKWKRLHNFFFLSLIPPAALPPVLRTRRGSRVWLLFNNIIVIIQHRRIRMRFGLSCSL